jgi:hypothetical protein
LCERIGIDGRHTNKTNGKKDVQEVKNISKFPFLPVKFSADGRSFGHRASRDSKTGNYFRVMIAQGGIAVVDVYFEK